MVGIVLIILDSQYLTSNNSLVCGYIEIMFSHSTVLPTSCTPVYKLLVTQLLQSIGSMCTANNDSTLIQVQSILVIAVQLHLGSLYSRV